MQCDLTALGYVSRPEVIIDPGITAVSVIPGKIDGVDVMIKTHKNNIEGREHYNNEKNAYLVLQNEDFLPKLLYFDDSNLKLCMTDVGKATTTFEHLDLLLYYDELRHSVINIMNKKYNVFHNDLHIKNVCIDEKNKIRIIDFDRASIGGTRKDTDGSFLNYIRKGLHKW
tara:strand:- start:627 stop:1136 length:510 start_codon:yes stop_codon:yes gene_type:complete